jgi:thymidylate synthase (FAD)
MRKRNLPTARCDEMRRGGFVVDNKIDVLDQGYVRLVDHMGSDLTIVNSARVSFDKASYELSEKDRRLIAFLAAHDHTSPFRHAMLQFEIYAPLMVARQWHKYRIGSTHMEGAEIDPMEAWNESSRRYVTEEPRFYVPSYCEWRGAPSNSKQGSVGFVEIGIGEKWTGVLNALVEQGEILYEQAMADGICAEQARLILPAYGMYVRWRWTASLQSVCHFINQRLNHDAQAEIQAYAKAVYALAKPLFPVSIDELVKDGEDRG